MKHIHFRVSDDKVFDLIDQYRFSKRGENLATWEKLILQALILSMLQDHYPEVDSVIKYATKPALDKTALKE